uniref:dCMP deaminase n=1 Tax=Oncorhynchus kisutch TaxID=8019 RepID=A0A8C7GTT8_ONCKI
MNEIIWTGGELILDQLISCMWLLELGNLYLHINTSQFLIHCHPWWVYTLPLFLPLSPVCHAELNAIMNKNSADVKGCSMYVALFPCNECAKLIIQAGSSSPSEASLSSILILLTLGCSTEQAEYTHLEKEERERVGALMSTPPLNLPHLEELKYVYCKC